MKYLPMNDELYAYLNRHRSDADDCLLAELRAETEVLGSESRMQISSEQGGLLAILVAVTGAKSIIEVGTFTGYSSLCMARALPADGRLLCLDQSEEWTFIARKYWRKAGVAEKIELMIGPAVESLKRLEDTPRFDFAFIDADKREYDAYYEGILPRMKRNSLIAFDNMLWGGSVLDSETNDPDTAAIRALNEKLRYDLRVECVLLPVADGMQLCRVR
jgi:caffeoyl-CoA O-methyltransferase